MENKQPQLRLEMEDTNSTSTDATSSPSTRSTPVRKVSVANSVARIIREYNEVLREPNAFWYAAPLSCEDPYEWHFTLRGPADTDFSGGLYHGRIILPDNYPFSAPNILLMTPNGRFDVGKKVCLSATNYHPELWQPAWGLRTMLDALTAFFPTPGEGALHSLDWPSELRKKLAKESVNWKCFICKKTNFELISLHCTAASNSRPFVPNFANLYNHVLFKKNSVQDDVNSIEDDVQEVSELSINSRQFTVEENVLLTKSKDQLDSNEVYSAKVSETETNSDENLLSSDIVHHENSVQSLNCIPDSGGKTGENIFFSSIIESSSSASSFSVSSFLSSSFSSSSSALLTTVSSNSEFSKERKSNAEFVGNTITDKTSMFSNEQSSASISRRRKPPTSSKNIKKSRLLSFPRTRTEILLTLTELAFLIFTVILFFLLSDLLVSTIFNT